MIWNIIRAWGTRLPGSGVSVPIHLSIRPNAHHFDHFCLLRGAPGFDLSRAFSVNLINNWGPRCLTAIVFVFSTIFCAGPVACAVSGPSITLSMDAWSSVPLSLTLPCRSTVWNLWKQHAQHNDTQVKNHVLSMFKPDSKHFPSPFSSVRHTRFQRVVDLPSQTPSLPPKVIVSPWAAYMASTSFGWGH